MTASMGWPVCSSVCSSFPILRCWTWRPPGLDRHAAYVALSRHRDQVELHYGRDDFADQSKLVRTLSRERTKDMASDYGRDFANQRQIRLPEPVAEKATHTPARDPFASLDLRPVAPPPARGMFDGLALRTPQPTLPAAPMDLGSAVQRLARATADIMRMRKDGYTELPHQRIAYDKAAQSLDAMRPDAARDLRAAFSRDMGLIDEAAKGRTNALDDRMDLLYFLKERTGFIRRYYGVCADAFAEQKRLIEAAEPPFDNPPCSEDGEPPYLSEWLDADTSIQIVGLSCVSLLSDALKLYLNLPQHRQLRFVFTEHEAKRLKKQFVATYRDALGEIFDTDWSNAKVDFAIIEQVVLARNRGQHGTNLTSFPLTHDDRTLAKHPAPFFISAMESQSLDGTGAALGRFFNPTIPITRDRLFAAIGEVEKLGEWIEQNSGRAAKWLDAQRAAIMAAAGKS